MKPNEIQPEHLDGLLGQLFFPLEELAIQQYQGLAPVLYSKELDQFLSYLKKVSNQSPANLKETSLYQPLQNLLQIVTTDNPKSVLINQGFLLENLAQIVFQMAFQDETPLSSDFKSHFRTGYHLSQKIAQTAIQQLKKIFSGNIQEGFDNFQQESKPLFQALYLLGEKVDENFGAFMNLSFEDMMGDFTSEILPGCVEIGFDRKKVVIHLTTSLMGDL